MGSRRKKKKRQKTEGCIGGEDLIGKLPDDILVRVLSLLAPKEIIKCGVLSRRWTTFPKLVPMTLEFARKHQKLSIIEETKFIHRINQVLDSYPGETLTGLSISCHSCVLDQRSQFDKWVQFAMAKKVRKFSLDLSDFSGRHSYPKYRFPPILYDKKRLRSRDIGLPRCTSLTHLRLECVNVTNKQIKHFLECCPFLESLRFISSDSLTSLKVDDSIQLKFLEIRHCNKLEILEISAPNLMSFKYMNRPVTSMPLKCAPQLNEMLVSDGFYHFLLDNFHLFTSYFSQIETLSLGVLASVTRTRELQWPIGIPTLRNLKHLTIGAGIFLNESLLGFASWIEASPHLRRFVFQENGLRFRKSRKAVKPWMCAHQHLKEVEFVRFVGDFLDIELAMYIIENAVNLRKIIFDCRNPPIEDTGRNKTSLAILGARELQTLLSPDVEFVLISSYYLRDLFATLFRGTQITLSPLLTVLVFRASEIVLPIQTISAIRKNILECNQSSSRVNKESAGKSIREEQLHLV